jgi:hypothetical protein
MRRYLLVLLFCLSASTVAAQTPVAGEDRDAIRSVIERQLDAFARDDGETAFGFASPGIRSLFGTADVFMGMVRQSYAPVYRPRSVAFSELLVTGAALVQLVDLVGPDGEPVIAAYEMMRMPDQSWRINGCTLLQAPARRV